MVNNTLFGGRIPFLQKIRYALGGAGDSLPYALFYTYFMLYLTDVAGINAVISGVIAGVAAFCDGFIDPTLGIYSDNNYRKHGTRRNVMIQGLVPLAIITVMLFLPINLAGGWNMFYYILISFGFVVFYSLFTMNYVAMGGELTDNYAERNTLRLIVSLGSPIWNYVGKGGPALVRSMMPDSTPKTQWFVVALAATLIYVVPCIIAVSMARSAKQVKEMRRRGEVGFLPAAEDEKESAAKFGLLSNLKSALALKALRINVIMILCFSMANGFVYALIAYVLSYSIGLSDAQQATFWLAASVTNWITLFLGTWLANHCGKKIVFVGSFALSAACCLVFLVIGMKSLFSACLFIICWTCVETPFWALYCTNGYEIADVDEFVSGKRRTSMILSIASFVLKLGPTLSLVSTGAMLALIGYVEGGVQQSARTIAGLHLYITIIPAVFLGIGALAFLRYPVNKQNFAALSRALEAKKKGESYTLDGFEDLLPKGYRPDQGKPV